MNCGVLLKKKNVEPRSPNRYEEGDAWIYTCIKRNTYFFVAFSVGKWTQRTCKRVIEKLSERTVHPFPHTKIEIFTDGNDDYTYVLPDYYADTCINYGQLVKIREKGKVIDKERRTIDLLRYKIIKIAAFCSLLSSSHIPSFCESPLFALSQIIPQQV